MSHKLLGVFSGLITYFLYSSYMLPTSHPLLFTVKCPKDTGNHRIMSNSQAHSKQHRHAGCKELAIQVRGKLETQTMKYSVISTGDHQGTMNIVRSFPLCLRGKGGGEKGVFKDGSPEAVESSISLCHLILFLLICVYLFKKV